MFAEHGLMGVVREGDDHAVDVVLRDELAEPVRPTEEEREPLGELVVQLGRTVIDEADEIDAVLPMVEHLESELLPDLACTDDNRVLAVAG